VKEKGNREVELWSNKIVTTKHEGDITITLLKEFKSMGDDRGTHLAPGVLPPALLPCPPALNVKECRSNKALVYEALPAGALHCIVASISNKHGGMSVEIGSTYAVIHSHAQNVGIAQLFCLKQHQGLISQLCCLQQCQSVSSPDQLIVRSKNFKFLEAIEQQVLAMEKEYARASSDFHFQSIL
jgi:hypothetical protein